MEVSGNSQVGSEEAKTGNKCDPCLLLNKIVNAEHYCVECDEFFCKSCSYVHKMSKLSRNHELLSQHEMPPQKIASTEENVCSKHSQERLNYFCNVHNNFACTLCITLEHRNCTIQYIDEIAADFGNCSEYMSLREKISSLLQKLEGMKAISTRHSQDLETMYRQFLSDVKMFRSEINNLLDSIEATILKEVQDIREFDMKAAQTVSTVCDTVITDVNKLVSNLEMYEQYKQHRQFVISAKKAEIQLREYEKKIEDISCQNKIRSYKLHKNQEALQAIQSMNILGTLVDIDKKSETTTKKRTKRKKTKGAHSHPKSLTAYYGGDINVKHIADKNDCWIKDGEMIDLYRIALTDAKNYAVKIVNVDSNRILSYLKLTAEPFGLACIEESQLVVTCVDTLAFVNVGKTLTLNKEIPVYGKCTGIVFNDHELFVSFTSPQAVIKLISLSGEILKTFSTDKTGQPLFKYPSHICLSWDKRKLCVTDRMAQSVTSLNLDDDNHTVYVDFEFGCPLGLTADKYGNVYVACTPSKIYQISSQKRHMQMFLNQMDRIPRPQSVTYCGKKDKLYISHFGPKRNVLTFYQLHQM